MAAIVAPLGFPVIELEVVMKTQKFATGTSLAIALAGLLGSAALPTQAVAAETVTLAHCYGVNTCKGHNDCKTAGNACKGQGSCKASGFVAMQAKACADVGGTVRDKATQTVQVDLVHCTGVNVCKGHNDCKTADHACKGQGSCKGTGFVAIPAKACTDIGGKQG